MSLQPCISQRWKIIWLYIFCWQKRVVFVISLEVCFALIFLVMKMHTEISLWHFTNYFTSLTSYVKMSRGITVWFLLVIWMGFYLCIYDYSSDYHCFADSLLWTKVKVKVKAFLLYHNWPCIIHCLQSFFSHAMSAMKDSQCVVLHPVHRGLTYTDMFPFPAM